METLLWIVSGIAGLFVMFFVGSYLDRFFKIHKNPKSRWWYLRFLSSQRISIIAGLLTFGIGVILNDIWFS